MGRSPYLPLKINSDKVHKMGGRGNPPLQVLSNKKDKGEKTMSKVTWKPGTFEYPIPAVMVSCGTMEKSNIITVAWTGIINSNPAMVYISVRPERYSYKMIKESGEFVINLTTQNLAYATDWCGVRSGAKYDKFKEMKLTKEKANFVSCPMIKESPVSIECKVKEIKELGSHHMFVAEVLAINSDEKYIDMFKKEYGVCYKDYNKRLVKKINN